MMAPDLGGAMIALLVAGVLLGVGIAVVGYFVITWIVNHISIV